MKSLQITLEERLHCSCSGLLVLTLDGKLYGIAALNTESHHAHDALGIDWASDTKDGGDHLNFDGAKKVSAYVGNWLSEAYGLKDKRNNPDYKHWEEDSVEYAAARN